MARSCNYCSTRLSKGPAGTKSKEHVIPDWLQIELGINAETVKAVKTDGPVEVAQLRSMALQAVTSGNVCRSCNNGWMSELEVSVQGHLPDLCRGRRKLSSLSGYEVDRLAEWAAKTSFSTLDCGIGPVRFLPEHPRMFYDQRKLPDGMTILALQFRVASTFALSSSFGWAMQGDPGEGVREELQQLSFKVLIQLEHLLLLVLFQPIPSYVLGLTLDFYVLAGDPQRIRWLPERADLAGAIPRNNLLNEINLKSIWLLQE